MHCRPSVFSQPFAKWFIKYSIDNTGVFIKTWPILGLIEEDSMPIGDGNITASRCVEGISKEFQVYGIANIKITNGSREIIWRNVRKAQKKVDAINNTDFSIRSNHEASPEENTDNKSKTENSKTQENETNADSANTKEKAKDSPDAEPPKIPDHIELSDQVILLPRPARMLGKFQISMRDLVDHQLNWINAGDTLGYYEFPKTITNLFTRAVKESVRVEIKSPVSGIVLNTHDAYYSSDYDYGEKHEDHKHIQILIAKDEAPPIGYSDTMYKRAYQALADYTPVIVNKSRNKTYISEFKGAFEGNLHNYRDVKKFLQKGFDDTPTQYIYRNIMDDEYVGKIELIRERRPKYSIKLEKFDIQKKWLKRAIEEYESGCYRLAIEFFERAMPRHKNIEILADCYFKIGLKSEEEINKTDNIAKQKKHRSNAEENFQNAILINPPHAGAREKLGMPPYENEQVTSNNESRKSKDSRKENKADENERGYKLMILWRLDFGFTHKQLDQRLVEKLNEANANPSEIHTEYQYLKNLAA